MLKEIAQYLISLGNKEKEIMEVGGRMVYTGEHSLKVISEATTTSLTIRNLTGLVDYLKANYDNLPPVLVHVESPTTVNVFSTYNSDKQRNHILQASAQLPDISFGRYMDTEQFNVLLQSCFVPTDDRALVLARVGNIKEENVRTTGDDGVSQQITVKSGVTTVSTAEVPNPVLLKPFRTFTDVTQPESKFIFRMQDGPRAALFEADGGEWKINAIHSIRDYLNAQLADLITSKQVTIIA